MADLLSIVNLNDQDYSLRKAFVVSEYGDNSYILYMYVFLGLYVVVQNHKELRTYYTCILLCKCLSRLVKFCCGFSTIPF